MSACRPKSLKVVMLYSHRATRTASVRIERTPHGRGFETTRVKGCLLGTQRASGPTRARTGRAHHAAGGYGGSIRSAGLPTQMAWIAAECEHTLRIARTLSPPPPLQLYAWS